MVPQNFTAKSQEAIQLAHQLANTNGQQALEPIHLLASLIEQEGGVVPSILKKLQTDTGALKAAVDAALLHLPRVSSSYSGALGQIHLSPDLTKMFVNAERAAQFFKDEYISTEHLLLALADGRNDTAEILHQAGVTTDTILKALKDVRGNATVDSAEPEAKYQALEKYSRDLTELARQEKLDPVIGRDEEIRRVMQVLT